MPTKSCATAVFKKVVCSNYTERKKFVWSWDPWKTWALRARMSECSFHLRCWLPVGIKVFVSEEKVEAWMMRKTFLTQLVFSSGILSLLYLLQQWFVFAFMLMLCEFFMKAFNKPGGHSRLSVIPLLYAVAFGTIILTIPIPDNWSSLSRNYVLPTLRKKKLIKKKSFQTLGVK